MKAVPAELVRYIESGSRFIVAGHKEPDGDCVGSQLALASQPDPAPAATERSHG